MQEFHGLIIQKRKLLVHEGREETRRKDLTAKDAKECQGKTHNPRLTRIGSNQDKSFIGVHFRHSLIRLLFAFLRAPSRPLCPLGIRG
jgi:hypothetical protein